MNQPQTEQTKTPFTYKHENLAFMLPNLMVVTPFEQVRKLEAVKIQLEEACKYPRHEDTATLLEKAADFIELLQKDSPGKSYFTPHLRRAAAKMRAALKQSEELNND